jgi:hypothetical protein
MMEKFDFEDTLDMLKDVIKDRRDYVYESHPEAGLTCHYVWNGEPDCVVGHVLVKIGISKADLQYGETRDAKHGKYSQGSAGNLLQDLRDNGVVWFDRDATTLLGKAQAHQDSGVPWGEAVKYAEGYVRGQRSERSI